MPGLVDEDNEAVHSDVQAGVHRELKSNHGTKLLTLRPSAPAAIGKSIENLGQQAMPDNN